jgi:hypothetical protein
MQAGTLLLGVATPLKPMWKKTVQPHRPVKKKAKVLIGGITFAPEIEEGYKVAQLNVAPTRRINEHVN